LKVGILGSRLKELGGAERVITRRVDMFQKQGNEASCHSACAERNLASDVWAICAVLSML